MRRFWIGGNWKMNGTLAQAKSLSAGVSKLVVSELLTVAIFPPFPHLSVACHELSHGGVHCGAQDLASQPSGAFTGAVSAEMLVDVGCRYVLIGHSERRHVFLETARVVREKFAQASRSGLKPVLCVGETLGEREAGLTESVVSEQLCDVLDALGPETLKNAVLAYEPVWAIGTGKVATPEQAQAVHAHLRSIVRSRDAKLADSLPIVYGGSVKASNARSLFAQPDINGALVGGASLDITEFSAIVACARDLAV